MYEKKIYVHFLTVGMQKCNVTLAKLCVSHKWLAQIQSARVLCEPWLWLALNNIPCCYPYLECMECQVAELNSCQVDA